MTTDSAQLESYRPALLGHCYRMLGSVFDADDAVQETMIRAWRGLDRFDRQAPLKSWLFRIATNVCLDELTARGRRARPIEEGSPAPGAPPLQALFQRPSSYWVEPILDQQVVPASADPAEQAILRQSIRLTFVAALQKLPPKQRAALLLAEVVGWSVTEVAEGLAMSVPAVNSALQRARATLAKRNEEQGIELSATQQELLGRYLTAFEQYNVDELTSLMRQDATVSMPPYAL
jgi:RNA polymerase sigma-70 factor, ECF subfamily